MDSAVSDVTIPPTGGDAAGPAEKAGPPGESRGHDPDPGRDPDPDAAGRAGDPAPEQGRDSRPRATAASTDAGTGTAVETDTGTGAESPRGSGAFSSFEALLTGDEPEENLRAWQKDRSRAPVATKIVIAGGFGVGKTTLVGTVSEIPPLQTEALMTEASAATDDVSAVPQKATTTVAMDYGRITLDDDLVLYLFGTPGQERFWFMWDDLTRGAIGAVVLCDTRRLSDCFPALDYFESSGLPYVVAVNHFEGSELFDADDVRDALTVPDEIPVLVMDAREQGPVVNTLLALVRHALEVSPE